MKWLSAGLTFVNFATVAGLFLGMVNGGLGAWVAMFSLLIGLVLAVAAYFATHDKQIPETPGVTPNYRRLWTWALAGCFAIFALRSFLWLLYIDDEHLRIQSPNNLGDLALHIAYIKNFANGVPIWPDNPIYVFSRLRYPAGADLFNALLMRMNVDLTRGLVWTGLLASVATFYGLYRWGGKFGVAGFLFNGGVVGFQFLRTFKFLDYQGDKSIAWKSIPLSMFVTQRGLLYAIPAGLLLLWHWREKFFRASEQDRHRTGLPFWVAFSIYASMPLFHVHTFMALSAVLFFLFIFGDMRTRKETLILVGAALIPATFFVWLITDHFQAGSVVDWQPGWLQYDPEFANPIFHFGSESWLPAIWNNHVAPIFEFWLTNFGLLIPLAAAVIALCVWQACKNGLRWGEKLPENVTFLLSAAAIFLVGLFVKLAPWAWDNLKVLAWAYLLVLPFLWKDLIAKQLLPARIALCVALFGSGFVSLFGGLAAGKPGYEFAERGELDSVGSVVRTLPVEARFAAFPIYNHPLLLQGRKVALGYPGHLWTQGFANYQETNAQLTSLMQGQGDWLATARRLGVRYIFWGREENMNYPTSTHPWIKSMATVASGTWGAIYDLESPRQPNADR